MSKKRGPGAKGCNDLVLAQRANIREANTQQSALKVLHQMQRRRICALDDQITEVKRDLRSIHREEPEYFYKSRPSSSTGPLTGRSSGSWGRPITAPLPGGKVAPMTATRPCWGRRTSVISSKPAVSRQSSMSSTLDDGRKKVASNWKIGKTLAKIDTVKAVTQKHIEATKKQKEDKPDFTMAELDQIRNINRWLSIAKMPEQSRIPPLAMKYIQNHNMELNLDLSTFLEKKFPPPGPAAKKVPSNVSKEVMEQQKKKFNNMTAARALLKFKVRLERFRAKTDEDRVREKMWEDLKNVRYLRIPGQPTEPDYYSSALFSS